MYLPGWGATFPDEKSLTFDATVSFSAVSFSRNRRTCEDRDVQVTISFTVVEPTDKIVLNAKNLTFEEAKTIVSKVSQSRKSF